MQQIEAVFRWIALALAIGGSVALCVLITIT
jgi:hypothetical protein